MHGCTDDYEQFRRVNEKLMTTKGGNWFKRAPFRVYVLDEKVRLCARARVRPHPVPLTLSCSLLPSRACFCLRLSSRPADSSKPRAVQCNGTRVAGGSV